MMRRCSVYRTKKSLIDGPANHLQRIAVDDSVNRPVLCSISKKYTRSADMTQTKDHVVLIEHRIYLIELEVGHLDVGDVRRQTGSDGRVWGVDVGRLGEPGCGREGVAISSLAV